MSIETKVIAAASGAGGGAATSAFVLWALGVIGWHASAAANAAGSAIGAVPTPVSGLVGVVLTVAGAAVAGYAAPHTSRTAPVPAVAQPDFPVVTDEEIAAANAAVLAAPPVA